MEDPKTPSPPPDPHDDHDPEDEDRRPDIELDEDDFDPNELAKRLVDGE